MKSFALIALLFPLALGYQIIESPADSNWGTWGYWSRCPYGRYAQAVQLRTEPHQGIFVDDTASNGIRLYCGDAFNTSTVYITSTVSQWGNWGSVLSCRSDGRPLPPDGYIIGFQLRVKRPYPGDNTATNNLRILCRYPSQGREEWKEGDGLTFGGWSAERRCTDREAICALQTQVEEPQGSGDDTALNNIKAECCDRCQIGSFV